MKLTRRDAMALLAGSAAAMGLSGLPAYAALEDDIAALTGGAELGEGGITLTAPEIAENGNTVPVEVSAPGAVAITIYADGNPVPAVATVKFGPLNPSQSARPAFAWPKARMWSRSRRWRTVRSKRHRRRSR